MTPAASDGNASMQLLTDWRYRAVVWSVLLSALGYLGFALWGGWRSVADAVGAVGVPGMVLVLGLSLVNYGLRFLRWQAYLAALGHRVPWGHSLRIYVAGFALTTTPAKAGEALRSVLLRPLGVPFTASLTAMLSERLSDVLAVLLLALLGLVAYPDARPLVVVGAAATFAAFLALSSLPLLNRLHSSIRGQGRVSRLLRHVADILIQARSCHAPRLLVLATGLGLTAWFAEAWAFHLVLARMGADVGLTLAISFYAISMLAGALSFMPGGLGGAEAAMIAMLHWAGVGTAESIAATVLIRLATLWFAVGLGTVSLLSLPPGAKHVTRAASGDSGR